MRIPGVKAVRHGLWRTRGRLFGAGVILGYHRVASVLSDPWDMCVPPDVFGAQMEVVRREFRPMTLSGLSRAIASGKERAGRPLVAITFDDGYVDVASAGLSVLEMYELPATLFVVADSMGGRFWWDRLQAVLELGSSLPSELDLKIGKDRFVWRRGRGGLAEALLGPLRSLSPAARAELTDALESWAGLSVTPDQCPAVLSADEVARLAGHPLVEIGSHSATHVELPRLPGHRLDREICWSRRRLEEVVGQPVESFSYPHGLVDARTRRAVAAAGYCRACASWNGLVSRRGDPFRRPRLWPSTASADEFREWLRGWTGR